MQRTIGAHQYSNSLSVGGKDQTSTVDLTSTERSAVGAREANGEGDKLG
jgi:hypothetical protein